MKPDNLKSAWLIFALAVGSFAIGATEFSTMSLLSYIADEFQVSRPQAGHLVSAYALGVVIGAPLIAVLFARFSYRFMLIFLMAFFACTHFLAVLAPSFSMLLWIRFFTGMPHGAYFAIASLVVAAIVPPERRTHSVGLLMMGSTLAITLGVLVSGWIGEFLNWRVSYALESALFAVNVVIIMLLFPAHAPSGRPRSHIRQELKALKNIRVWLTLLTTAIGFGGYFAVYTFAGSSLEENTSIPRYTIPLVLALFGVGMTLSNYYVTRYFAARPFIGVMSLFLLSTCSMLLYACFYRSWWMVCMLAVLIGLMGSTSALIQVSLIKVAQEAQTLAAALNHSACNAANALGPFLAGLALEQGWGYGATGAVGSALCFFGFLIGLMTCRYIRANPPAPPKLASLDE